jgi:hypothetical protein
MKQFKLICTGGPYGDCTSSYDVIFLHGEDISVKDFVEMVLLQEPNEWGSIRNGMCEVIADYKYGEAIFRKIYDSIKDKKIVSIKAHGGWSMMDYYLELEPQPKLELSYDFQQLSIFDF